MKTNAKTNAGKVKKGVPLLALLLCAALLTGVFAACNRKKSEESKPPAESKPATDALVIRLIHPNAAQESLWESLAADYKAQTGVTILPEYRSDYTERLKERLGAAEPPTIFLLSSHRDYSLYKDHLADLSESNLAAHLLDRDLALTAESKIIGLPAGIEAFGIIYNKAVLDQYFALTDKASDAAKAEDVTSFAKLETLAKDLTAKKVALGIDGAFAPVSLKEGEADRWSGQLLSVPLAYEYRNGNVDLTGSAVNEITFRYADNYRKLFDLYTANSTLAADKLETVSYQDAADAFAAGKCAMVQGDTALWGRVSTAAALKRDDLGFLPLYMGFDDEATQGLTVSVTQYFAVNAKAPEDEQAAAAAFLTWLYSSEKGKDFVSNQLGAIAPYDTFTQAELPDNPLARAAVAWLTREGVTAVVAPVALIPGEEFRNTVVAAGLKGYAAGTTAWDKFKADVISGWKSFSEKIKDAA
ncbi:MAG: ABC transporter substrate-binding protein [Oscillospiraceae bacterium]|jgi:raffinose/stachyose/melibiose transport system substrate-binding protein|nr:ABC transporter substrate-binding protein [Oscillospiraceae bacterium]